MYTLDYKEYAKLARLAAAEGIVLLENKDELLPLKEGTKLTLLGRTQFDTMYTGSGSGGMVNIPFVVTINEALSKAYDLETESQKDYKEWLVDHPFDEGPGWGQEPWSQEEMPISAEKMQTYAANSDIALFVIGRTAGEDRDNTAQKGAYYLSETELEVLKLARNCFKKLIVVFNVANIIDTSWNEEIKADALVYMWQGGVETGNALLDVLSGKVNPSGHLVDTIAYNLEDYPSSANFANEEANFYQEDIYVGYRYFETFNKEAVQYPFGYGLSYTDFAHDLKDFSYDQEKINLSLAVKNIGKVSGKAVPQIYIEAPQGKLGKPSRVLVDFAKTKDLEPDTVETFDFEIDNYTFSSFDDSGKTGFKNSYVLEAGVYKVYAGFDVREAKLVASFELKETKPIQKLEEALAPSKDFERLVPVVNAEGELEAASEEVPLRTFSQNEYFKEEDADLEVKDTDYSFNDYLDGKISLDEFVEQFTNEDLIYLSLGIGMQPAGVKPGIAGAFGGVNENLAKKDIPLVAVSDGPSGIRMDDGTMAFQVPIGTALAASFNLELNHELYKLLGLELRKNQIDALLGPGMNIHRHPLNGRNFEYFSEDPFLTGKVAAAQVNGLASVKVAATAKHFAANNQEYRRHFVDSIVSQRALREIYLKGFEILVKESKLNTLMSSYNPVNGIWAASNYELNTVLLREEWGYQGLVMTDWFAKMNYDLGEEGKEKNTGAMIRAQNDVYMVLAKEKLEAYVKNALEDLKAAKFSRSDLLRNAKNILKVTAAIYHGYHELALEVKNQPEIKNRKVQKLDLSSEDLPIRLSKDELEVSKHSYTNIYFELAEDRELNLSIDLDSHLDELSQQNINISLDDVVIATINLRGGAKLSKDFSLDLEKGKHVLELFYSEAGFDLSLSLE